MPAPENALKAAMLNGETRCGLWLAQANATLAEIAGQAGFDWCLIDAEHGRRLGNSCRLWQVHPRNQRSACQWAKIGC